MPQTFYIVGPTATGKSAIAAEVARLCGGEIVSADAFQIYAGLDLLSAKPEPAELAAAPHHLIGVVPLSAPMDAERFRELAASTISAIHGRGKPAFVVGGSGLYVKALADGLSTLPRADADLRARLDQLSEMELFVRLARLDPESAGLIDRRNKRRLIRAVEICLLTGRPASAQRQRATSLPTPAGVLLWRDRTELYERINARVKLMFARGVIAEVRASAESVGPTAAQMLGFAQIRELIAGRISESECIASIQQATRRYAKRQLTWFSRQTSFEPLNISRSSSSKTIAWIARQVRLAPAPTG